VTTARSRRYGYGHQLDRKRWASLVETGTVPCGRCREKILADEPWDLDHLPGGVSLPSHRRCNRATKSHRVLALRHSRVW
jgi:hypothetical protein